MKRLLLLFALSVMYTGCTKEEIDCETYYQVTIELSDKESYTTFVFSDDALYYNSYGDTVIFRGTEGVITEKLPFNTCPDKQPYL